MTESQLLRKVGRQEADKEEIADNVIKKPELLPEIMEGLNSDAARIKYGCAKVLHVISEKRPEILYPRFDFFIALIDSNNTFLKWAAILIIANLTVVDTDNKFEKVFDKYFAPISGPVMITAANVVKGAAKIALSKLGLAEKISKELLKVEKAKYQTTECHNIALGHAIKAFDQFFNQIKDQEPVITLVKKQLKNTRNGTRKKAEIFIKKHKLIP